MKKLFNIFRRKKSTKIIILQWGKKRSLIKNGSDEVLLIDNNYLMNLDEMGLIS